MALSIFLRNARSRPIGMPLNFFKGVQMIRNFSNLTERPPQTILARFLTSKWGKSNFNNMVFKRNMSGPKGDHATMWKIEKSVAGLILLAAPGAFIFPGPIMDNILSICILLHIHWGLEAIAQDYIRPLLFGPVIPKIAIAFVCSLTALTTIGVIKANMNGNGIAKTMQKFWALGKEDSKNNKEKVKTAAKDAKGKVKAKVEDAKKKK